MTPEQLDAIETRERAAHDHITELCDGRKRWTMRIPADPEHDSDLVISRSLSDIPALVAEVRRLRTAVDAVRTLHRPFRIYDQCDHDHSEEEGEPTGWFVVDEVGPTCEDGYMYTICHRCCTGGWDFQTEECVDGHKHGPDAPYCQTIRTLDAALDPKEQTQ